MRKTLHIQADERTRRLAAIRASEQSKTLSEYVASLIQQDAEATGLRRYLERENREEACGE